MHLLRLHSIALAVAGTHAAVLPRQQAASPQSSSTQKPEILAQTILTEITSLPLPSSVSGNTAYPPTTTESVSISTQVWTEPTTEPSSSPRPPFTWHDPPNRSDATAGSASATTSNAPLATSSAASDINSTLSSISASISSLTSSIANVTSSLPLSTGALGTGSSPDNANATAAPFANSTTTMTGTVAGVAATGTAVRVTGISNVTASSTVRFANTTTTMPVQSTSMIVQLYLPSALGNEASTTTEIPLGSNMTLVVSDEPSTASASATGDRNLAKFGNTTTTAAGVAAATGTGASGLAATGSGGSGPYQNATAPASTTKKPAGTGVAASSTMATSTVKANNATTSSESQSTGSSSSSHVSNAVDNSGAMFAVNPDGKNGTIIELVPASNSTSPMAATGTASAVGSTGTAASASLGRRDVPPPTAAPITPATAEKKSWTQGFPGFSYSRSEYIPRPSRFFSGDGWSWRGGN